MYVLIFQLLRTYNIYSFWSSSASKCLFWYLKGHGRQESYKLEPNREERRQSASTFNILKTNTLFRARRARRVHSLIFTSSNAPRTFYLPLIQRMLWHIIRRSDSGKVRSFCCVCFSLFPGHFQLDTTAAPNLKVLNSHPRAKVQYETQGKEEVNLKGQVKAKQ